jgi:uncharacterized DUF497 family protein
MRFHGFDWDAGNRAKCQKHGLSIAEIEALFEGEFAIFPDLAHSSGEQRLRAIGRGSNQRWIFCVFTLRAFAGAMFIRPISARYMHAREIRHYEKETARSENR